MGSDGKGINLTAFEILSTMVVMLFELGSSVMKPMAIWDQGHCEMESGMSFPTGNVQGTLDLANDEEDETYFCTSVLI